MIILFDAVGTLLQPNPGVLDAYAMWGQRFGSQLSKEQMKSEFGRLRQTIFGSELDPQRSTPSDLQAIRSTSSHEREKELWRQLIYQMFLDVEDRASLFERLWDHFANPAHWKIYDDVEACWKSLQNLGYQIGIASNFDDRLNPICEQSNVLSSAAYVFCSSQIGFRKPDPRFWQAVREMVPSSQVWMIGDDPVNDYLSPMASNIQAIHLVRNKTFRFAHSVSSLREVVSRISQT